MRIACIDDRPKVMIIKSARRVIPVVALCVVSLLLFYFYLTTRPIIHAPLPDDGQKLTSVDLGEHGHGVHVSHGFVDFQTNASYQENDTLFSAVTDTDGFPISRGKKRLVQRAPQVAYKPETDATATTGVRISHPSWTGVPTDDPVSGVHHSTTEVHKHSSLSMVHTNTGSPTLMPRTRVPISNTRFHGYHFAEDNHMLFEEKEASELYDFWDVMNKSYVGGHSAPTRVNDYTCKDALCSEFLSQEDWRRVDRCINKFRARGVLAKVGPTMVPHCHFVNHTSHLANVLLISFPGSGNTWVRGLLEKTTGICTGEKVYT